MSVRSKKRLQSFIALAPKSRYKPDLEAPLQQQQAVGDLDGQAPAPILHLSDVVVPPTFAVPETLEMPSSQLFNPLSIITTTAVVDSIAQHDSPFTSRPPPPPPPPPMKPKPAAQLDSVARMEPEPAAPFVSVARIPSEPVAPSVSVARMEPEPVRPSESAARIEVGGARASIVDEIRLAVVDCQRCSVSSDGLWHTFVHVVPFYRALHAISVCRGEDGAEARWYAVLERAGIARGQECSALRWPPSDVALGEQTIKVHALARVLLDLLCKTAVHDSSSDFVEQIVIPSLLCLHEQALRQHPTLRAAEAELRLEPLNSAPGDIGAAAALLTQVRNALAWSLPLSTIAQLCCAVISAPSLGMQCAYQCTKSVVDANGGKAAWYDELRRSISTDSANATDGAPWTAWSERPPLFNPFSPETGDSNSALQFFE